MKLPPPVSFEMQDKLKFTQDPQLKGRMPPGKRRHLVLLGWTCPHVVMWAAGKEQKEAGLCHQEAGPSWLQLWPCQPLCSPCRSREALGGTPPSPPEWGGGACTIVPLHFSLCSLGCPGGAGLWGDLSQHHGGISLASHCVPEQGSDGLCPGTWCEWPVWIQTGCLTVQKRHGTHKLPASCLAGNPRCLPPQSAGCKLRPLHLSGECFTGQRSSPAPHR